MDNQINKNILKTGTTILGIVCKDGIVMAADRQISGGELVMGKDARKVFKVNDYLVIAGCGVAGDIQRVPKLLGAELRLKELRSKSRPTIKQAASLLSNISYSGIRQPSMIPQQAGFLLGGFNENGTIELYTIEPAGSFSEVKDYDANFGSGMPFVLGFLERTWKKGLTIKEGINLAMESIKSSTNRDKSTGYGIDIYSITKEGIKLEVEQEAHWNYD